MQQPKLNQRHVKWIEYLQNFTFVIKHISGQSNKIADALSRRALIIQGNQVQVTAFDSMKELYGDDADFKEAFEVCENPAIRDRNPWLEYIIHDCLLFKGNQLCIPKCLARETLIKEKHSGGLSGHFGHDKTLEQLKHFYFWPRMREDVQNFSSQE